MCFSCVIPTINFQRLGLAKDIVSDSLVFYCLVYIFETVCKIIDGKIYFLTYPEFQY